MRKGKVPQHHYQLYFIPLREPRIASLIIELRYCQMPKESSRNIKRYVTVKSQYIKANVNPNKTFSLDDPSIQMKITKQIEMILYIKILDRKYWIVVKTISQITKQFKFQQRKVLLPLNSFRPDFFLNEKIFSPFN